MEDSLLRIPVVCPECGEELLTEFPEAVVAEALNTGDTIRLHASCHARRGRRVTSNANSSANIWKPLVALYWQHDMANPTTGIRPPSLERYIWRERCVPKCLLRRHLAALRRPHAQAELDRTLDHASCRANVSEIALCRPSRS